MNPRNRGLIVGATVGALLGALTGWFIFQQPDPAGEGEQAPAKPIGAGDVFKLATSALGVLRQIVDLRQRV